MYTIKVYKGFVFLSIKFQNKYLKCMIMAVFLYICTGYYSIIVDMCMYKFPNAFRNQTTRFNIIEIWKINGTRKTNISSL